MTQLWDIGHSRGNSQQARATDSQRHNTMKLLENMGRHE